LQTGIDYFINIEIENVTYAKENEPKFDIKDINTTEILEVQMFFHIQINVKDSENDDNDESDSDEKNEPDTDNDFNIRNKEMDSDLFYSHNINVLFEMWW
jgi:hypothetical protein